MPFFVLLFPLWTFAQTSSMQTSPAEKAVIEHYEGSSSYEMVYANGTRDGKCEVTVARTRHDQFKFIRIKAPFLRTNLGLDFKFRELMPAAVDPVLADAKQYEQIGWSLFGPMPDDGRIVLQGSHGSMLNPLSRTYWLEFHTEPQFNRAIPSDLTEVKEYVRVSVVKLVQKEILKKHCHSLKRILR